MSSAKDMVIRDPGDLHSAVKEGKNTTVNEQSENPPWLKPSRWSYHSKQVQQCLNLTNNRNPALCEQPSSSRADHLGDHRRSPSNHHVPGQPGFPLPWGAQIQQGSVLGSENLWLMAPTPGTELLTHLWQGNGTADLRAPSTPSFWGFMNCQSHLGLIWL